MKVRHLLIGLASGTALYSGFASALGLGEIELHSALSEPLNAEIKLLNVGDLDNNDLRVRLAPPEIYSRAGVERLMFFNDLRFTPVFDGQNSVIRIASSTPVSEPYLNFIVEVVRPSGQIYREYTLLLDPPGFSAYQSVSAVQSVSAAQVATPSPRVATAPVVTPKAELGKSYNVVTGDSLWKIAQRHAGSATEISSMMADIHALNPQAFVGGDMSRLRAGVELRLPDSASTAVAAVDAPVVPAATASPASLPAVTDAAAVEQRPEPEASELTQAMSEEAQQAEQALLKQQEQTQQLQANVDTLAQQIQQLQEQMIARDQQIALLQEELAERTAAAAEPAPVAAPVAPVQDAGVESGSPWWSGVSGLMGLVLAGVLALLWRRKREPKAGSTVAEAMPVVTHKPATITPVYVRASQVANDPLPPAKAPAPQTDAMQTANVYIAYGHYKEAAATLAQAWADEPQRGDLGFRYLEVLAKLGNAQTYLEVEPQVRASGFNPVRLDELKASYAQLFSEPPVSLLADVQLDEPVQPGSTVKETESQLNLDDFMLNAEWDAVNPFAPVAPQKSAPVQETATIFDLADSRDARSPFAQSMLVEESADGGWKDELSTELLELDLQLDDDYAGTVQDNLTKLNIAQAFIDQGNIEGACKVLNEVIVDGDEHAQQEARELLAKIA